MKHLLIVITLPILACPHTGSSIIEITTPEHHRKLLQDNMGPCAILYYLQDCTYCKEIYPVFEKLARHKNYDHITFYKINGPQLQAESDAQIIAGPWQGYPSILFFNHGKLINQQIGSAPQNVIIQKLDSLDDNT